MVIEIKKSNSAQSKKINKYTLPTTINNAMISGELSQTPIFFSATTQQSANYYGRLRFMTFTRDIKGDYSKKSNAIHFELRGRFAEKANQDLKVGDIIYLEGKLVEKEFIDKHTNIKKYRIIVVASSYLKLQIENSKNYMEQKA